MTKKDTFKRYIPMGVIVALLGVGAYGTYNYTTIIDDLKAKLAAFDSDKKQVEEEFTKLNDEYHSMMTSMSEKDQLLIEKQASLQNIKAELEKVLNKQKIQSEDLAQAKVLIAVLKKELEINNIKVEFGNEKDKLITEKTVMKNLYEVKISDFKNIIVQKDQKISEQEKIIFGNKKTIHNNLQLIKKGATLRLINFDIKGVNVRANGKEEETDKARKADKLKVSFEVNDNNISETGEKELYISIFDVDGKLIHFPEATSGNLTLNDGTAVEYTDYIRFMYNKGEPQTVKFVWKNDDFNKGDYRIKVYQNNSLIGSETKSFR